MNVDTYRCIYRYLYRLYMCVWKKINMGISVWKKINIEEIRQTWQISNSTRLQLFRRLTSPDVLRLGSEHLPRLDKLGRLGGQQRKPGQASIQTQSSFVPPSLTLLLGSDSSIENHECSIAGLSGACNHAHHICARWHAPDPQGPCIHFQFVLNPVRIFFF